MLPKSHLRRNRNQFQVSDQGRDIAADNAIESTGRARGRRIFFASILGVTGVFLVATSSSGKLASIDNIRYLRQLAADDSKDADSVDKRISPEISKVVQKLAAPFLADEANIFAFDENDSRPIMNTFFAIPKGQSIGREHAEILAVWKQAWSQSGWNPRILNIGHAEAHPDFANIDAMLKEVPLGIDPTYDRACYLRHFAMAANGGGWMSDYDTVPLNIDAEVDGINFPNDGKFTTFETHVPSLIVGDADEWDRVSKALLREGVAAGSKEGVGIIQEGRPRLFSDMFALENLVKKDEVIVKEPFSVFQAHDAGKSMASKIMALDLETTAKNLFNGNDRHCNNSKNIKALHFSHHATGRIGYPMKDRSILIAAFLDRWSKLCSGPSFHFDDNTRTDAAPKAEISSENNNVELSSSDTSATNTTRTVASSMVSDK